MKNPQGRQNGFILHENNGEENIQFYEQIELIFEFINILHEVRIEIWTNFSFYLKLLLFALLNSLDRSVPI